MFNCTSGTSYLLRDVFNMTLSVYILIDIYSKGLSARGYLFYCDFVYSKRRTREGPKTSVLKPYVITDKTRQNLHPISG